MVKESGIVKEAAIIPIRQRQQKQPVKEKRKPISNSVKAGITFPVGRVCRHLRQGLYAKHIRIGGAVYMASVLEYLTAEILELGGEACMANRRQRITPRHIQLAIRNDTELSDLLQNATIPGGGVLAHIEPYLLKKLTRQKVVAPVENSLEPENDAGSRDSGSGDSTENDDDDNNMNNDEPMDNNETNAVNETNDANDTDDDDDDQDDDDDEDEQLEESAEI